MLRRNGLQCSVEGRKRRGIRIEDGKEGIWEVVEDEG
jgi:hypothetical protein